MLKWPAMPVSSGSFQVLTADDVLAHFRALRSRQPVNYWAFYSSQLGGIVTDPALMVLPFDDHMVHRGHGIFDTAGLVDGKIYDLEAHLDRFLLSADRSKLRLPGSRDDIRDIIVKTAAASSRRDGSNLVLALVRTGQPGPHAGGGRRAGLLRHGVRRALVLTPSGGTPKV